MKKSENLRGWEAIVDFDGAPRMVTIITHIRGDRWMVEGRELPKRFERYRGCRRTVVMRSQMMLYAGPEGATPDRKQD